MSSTLKCDVQFQGPFTFASGKHSVFDQKDLIDRTGLYFWSVDLKDTHRVSYVGETGKSFKHRFKQHLEGYLSGVYRLHEPEVYAAGKKQQEPLWGGTWMKGTRDNLPLFMERYLELAPRILAHINALRVFVAPLEVETRIRRRIEGAIARVIFDYQQHSGIKFLEAEDNNKKVRRGKQEPAIHAQISVPCQVEGLDVKKVNEVLNSLAR